jgi:Mitochondrial ribosomal protein (VAR1)
LYRCNQQLININEYKFNYNYLQFLKKYLERIYNKNIEFNLVNLRRFFLNSDILSESIILKIRKNRRKILKFLNSLKRKVKIHNKRNLYYEPVTIKLNNSFNYKSLEKLVIKDIKYRHVTGFRLETGGRLTRRYTASRSISKLRYKGNLLNIDSSYRGLSSLLLKGNLKSNLQFTKLNSKTRIGSFGIKG